MSSTKTIGEQLASLLRLQEIDAKLYALLRQKKEKPLELEASRKRRDAQKGLLTQQEKGVTELQMKRKTREVDLETKEGAIKKYQTQLYQVKTNKEYQSLQKEIEVLKADNSVLEEEILKLMEEVDQKKGDLLKQKEALAAFEADLARDEKRISDEISAIDKDLAAFKEQRESFVPTVERKLFQQYDRILAAKEGLAVVPIEGDSSCGGCHINLPPQVINEVQLQERVVVCGNCARILYERSAS